MRAGISSEDSEPGLRARSARLGRAVLDLVLPPRCHGCGNLVPHTAALCAACWGRLRFLGPPLCRSCGLPLPPGLAGLERCESCRQSPLPLDRVRAALAYDEASRDLVIGFKHAGRIEAAELLARLMVEAGRELLAGADLVLPVPLHRWRLLRRGYNQSAMLAARIARLSGCAWSPDLLLRRVATPSQQGLGKAARARNITPQAFALRARRSGEVSGRAVLLVDDVLTSGATLGACARILRDAGAARVDALLVARVVQDGTLLI
jgi:ComF family protein